LLPLKIMVLLSVLDGRLTRSQQSSTTCALSQGLACRLANSSNFSLHHFFACQMHS
jgi:hypothetical protein